MKILQTPDNVARIAHITLVDQQVQERYDHIATDPHHALRRWFSQAIKNIQNEPLGFKEQWLQLVDAAFLYYL
jgi:hypothetical protein